jgi:hypothetical protein
VSKAVSVLVAIASLACFAPASSADVVNDAGKAVSKNPKAESAATKGSWRGTITLDYDVEQHVPAGQNGAPAFDILTHLDAQVTVTGSDERRRFGRAYWRLYGPVTGAWSDNLGPGCVTPGTWEKPRFAPGQTQNLEIAASPGGPLRIRLWYQVRTGVTSGCGDYQSFGAGELYDNSLPDGVLARLPASGPLGPRKKGKAKRWVGRQTYNLPFPGGDGNHTATWGYNLLFRPSKPK